MSKSSLLDELKAGSAPTKSCGIGKIRNVMNTEEQEENYYYIRNPFHISNYIREYLQPKSLES